MRKTYNCSISNMCENSDKKFICCHYCDEKRCKYRCKDSVSSCEYRIPEGQVPISGISRGVK